MRAGVLVPALSLLTTSLIPQTAALEANTNSPCAPLCGNVLESTSGSDIVCKNSDYSQSAGVTFSGCVECQLTSTYVDPVSNTTDLQWALYNMRYAISWCLFGFPNNTAAGSSSCTTSFSCAPLKDSIEYNNLSSSSLTEYDYCEGYSGWSAQTSKTRGSCQGCLAESTPESYLANFATVLDGACSQLPVPGTPLSFEGSAFSTTQLNMTSPTPSSWTFQAATGLSLGSRIGIAVGAILAALFLAGFCIIWNGRRRRRNVLRKRQAESGYAAWQSQLQHAGQQNGSEMNSAVSGQGGFWDSPQSQRPLNPQHWGAQVPTGGINTDVGQQRGVEEESPLSGVGEKAYFSPYSSQFSSPLSAADQGKGEWPGDRKGSFGHGGGSFLERLERRERRKREEMESVEMTNVGVAPTIRHPGNGRDGAF